VEEASRRSAKAVADIKNCLPDYIARIALRFEEAVGDGKFRQFLGNDVVLVPAPRSAPFKSKDAAWPARQICDALASRGLCATVEDWLERHTTVKKSALTRKGTDGWGLISTQRRSGAVTFWRLLQPASRSWTTW
jgi:hypothetical protein